jgi:type II secretory pathway pseudopilin PulG
MRRIAAQLSMRIAGLALLGAWLLAPEIARAQNNQGNNDPAAALSAAFTAACRANETEFATYLTVDNASAFRALSVEQRAAFLKRFALSDQPGKPLLSSDARNHTVLRCETPAGTVEFRFGEARTRENLSFIPVNVPDGQNTEFGLVRENGGWRLLSLGLVLLDIPQLNQQWAEQELVAREDAAMADLNTLSDAIQKYQRVFGKLPNTLAQLGPAPKDQISPDQASLVDEHLAAGKAGGYSFRYRIAPAADGNDTNFEIAATPDDYGKGGRRSFFLDTSGQIHGEDKHGALASSDDPVVVDEKQP